jgi:hypothetical protein
MAEDGFNADDVSTLKAFAGAIRGMKTAGAVAHAILRSVLIASWLMLAIYGWSKGADLGAMLSKIQPLMGDY